LYQPQTTLLIHKNAQHLMISKNWSVRKKLV